MSRRRSRARRLPTRRLLYLAIFIIAALVGSSFVRVTLQDNALAREAAAVRAEILLLEAQQAALHAEIAMRETDAYVEQKARELGYVKPGEGLASVRGGTTPRSASNADGGRESSRLERWLSLFFDR
jgi:cell division protein FtsB